MQMDAKMHHPMKLIINTPKLRRKQLMNYHRMAHHAQSANITTSIDIPSQQFIGTNRKKNTLAVKQDRHILWSELKDY